MRMSRGMSGGEAMGEGAGGILSFMSTLPPWLSAIITIAGLILLAWIVGMILGKLYSGIKYPYPNKPSVFSAKQKVLFLGVAVAVVVLLFTTLLKPSEPTDGFPGDGASMGELDGGPGIDKGEMVIAG